MLRTTTAALVLAFTAAMLNTQAQAQTIPPVYSEDFAAATSRDSWYSSGAASAAPYDSTAKAIKLTALNAGSGKHILTYFDSTALAIGDSLTLDLTFSVSGTTGGTISGVSGATDQFRFGLFNSGANGHVSKDNHGVSGTSSTNGITDGFSSYVGYSPTMAKSSLGLRERDALTGQLLTAADAYTAFNSANNELSSDYVTGTLLTSGQTYSIRFALTRVVADIMSMSMIFSGTDSEGTAFSYTISGQDKTGIISTFDTLGISVNNSTVDFLIKSVEINHTIAPVPEPSTVAMLAGLTGLLAASLIRFRQRH